MLILEDAGGVGGGGSGVGADRHLAAHDPCDL